MAIGANIGASISIKLRDAYRFRLHPGVAHPAVPGAARAWFLEYGQDTGFHPLTSPLLPSLQDDPHIVRSILRMKKL
jgi:hypothetical protein